MRLFGYLQHCYERIKYGYSYRDVWSIDIWFLDVMPRMLRDLSKTTHGAPYEFIEKYGEDNGYDEWKKQLKEIADKLEKAKEDTIKNEYEEEMSNIFSEKIYYKDNNNGTCTMCEKEYSKEEQEIKELYYKRFQEIMVQREAELRDGLALFSKYFWSLWD